jgi:lysozyme
MRVTSSEGVALIKKFEGCELEAYQCSADVWTLGYGHTSGVSEGDTCTAEEAESMLTEDLQKFEGYVNDLVEVDLTQNQFDALVAWTYNLGPGALKESTGGKVLDGLVRRREAEALLFKGEPWEDV